MKHPANWNRSDLHQHLQHALNLELWTIPLYLTALYSIKDLKKLNHQDYPEAAKLLLSVLIQEMLHMELVCNISNALGYPPRIPVPNYDEQKGIPFIHPSGDYLPADLRGYKVRPQALNEHSLRLFCAIELPHPKKETVWEKEKSYNSIADLYQALKTGIAALWDECWVGDQHNTKQKNSFYEYRFRSGMKHGFSQHVHSPETAFTAIDAIIEQGEGADSVHVPADFRPHHVEEGKEFETALYKGNLSHYQKFRILLHSHHRLPEVYEEYNKDKNSGVQQNLKKLFLDFLAETEVGFNSDVDDMPDLFWNKMFGLGAAISEVWEAGMCPEF
jgi:hypothetical protein